MVNTSLWRLSPKLYQQATDREDGSPVQFRTRNLATKCCRKQQWGLPLRWPVKAWYRSAVNTKVNPILPPTWSVVPRYTTPPFLLTEKYASGISWWKKLYKDFPWKTSWQPNLFGCEIPKTYENLFCYYYLFYYFLNLSRSSKMNQNMSYGYCCSYIALFI